MNKSKNNKTDEISEEEKSSHIKIEYTFEEIAEESNELEFDGSEADSGSDD